ncbi:MAG: sporulation protein YqfD [Clostridia bacterium]|nr:sporulation protein YqfD [Clostridia bacterium]
MKQSNNSYSKISLTGLNLENYINVLKNNNIELFNVERPQYNQLRFITKSSNLKYINATKGSLELNVIKKIGYSNIKEFTIKNLGYIIGVIISIIMLVVTNAFTFNIHILGLENVSKDTILSSLQDYGIKTFKINKFDKDDLISYMLDNNSDLSLVSLKKVGTTLIFNIKEKSSKLPETVTPYMAPDNMLINDYSIHSGISNIYIDKVVKKGEVLIYPEQYLDKEGNLQLIEPKGTINATIWHTATDTIMKEDTIYERTGNKVTSYSYSIGDWKILGVDRTHEYEYVEEVVYNKDISNTLIPLKYTSTIYYETTPIVIQNDFNSIKDEIIANLESVVYNKVAIDENIQDKVIDIVELDDRYIVNVYLECTITINI